MNHPKYRVVVTYVEAGMGHITSAESVAGALEKYYPDEVEVIRCNIFTETNDPVLIKYQQFLIDEVKRSNKHPFHMFYIRLLKLPICSPLFSLTFANATIFRREKKHTIEILKKYDPDMAFHTHFAPLHYAVEAQKKRYGGHFLTGVYVPDPFTHGWWDRRADLAAFNTPRAYADAMKLKFNPETSLLSNFTLREMVINAPKDKTVLRKKLGLPEDRFTITLASSAYAGGLLQKFADRLLRIDRPFTLLIIAGSNEEVYQELSAKIGSVGHVDLRVYRFVKNAHELYGASDIFVTKAGPNAILDSAYMGTPVMTNFCASVIEQKTKTYFIDEQKVGVHFKDVEEAAGFLLSCMDDPSILKPYIENCRHFGETYTGGERKIADAIVETLRKSGPPKAARRQEPLSDAEPKQSKEDLLPV